MKLSCSFISLPLLVSFRFEVGFGLRFGHSLFHHCLEAAGSLLYFREKRPEAKGKRNANSWLLSLQGSWRASAPVEVLNLQMFPAETSGPTRDQLSYLVNRPASPYFILR